MEEGTWQTILKRKYIGPKALSQFLWKPGDSQFWVGPMATNKFFFSLGSFSIKDGSKIRFWEDRWLGNTTIREQYPALYNIVCHKGDTIAKLMEVSEGRIQDLSIGWGPRAKKIISYKHTMNTLV
jgi:hypothetical protein